MKRGCLWTTAIIIVLIAVAGVVRMINDHRLQAELDEQLKLAHLEGMPTNAAEFAATIPTAKPEENAAEFYRKLKIKSIPSKDIRYIGEGLLYVGDAKAKAAADEILKDQAAQLQLIDEATSRPRCWFDRNWTLGLAVLYPELATMKSAGKLLSLRAFKSALNGDSVGAIRDVHRIFRVSEHVGEEGHTLSALVRDTVYGFGLMDLADLSFRYPNVPAYREELVRAVDQMPKPDLRRENRSDLWDVLSIVELTTTPKGLADLGLKPENVSPMERVVPLLLNRTKAKIDMVKAKRAYWKALEEPPAKRKADLEAADLDLSKAMLAYPTALDIYSKLSVDDTDIDRDAQWTRIKQEYIAFLRSTAGKVIAKTIKTSDLLSPLDGKPLTYRFDGTRIEIAISGFHDGLTIPKR